MYFYLDRNSKKWTFYSVKILKCECFLSALQRNSEKRKIPKSRPFLVASVKTLKSSIFNE